MGRLARLLESLANRGNENCLYSECEWASYADLATRIVRARHHLDAGGTEPGTVIGFQPDYSLDSIAFLLAAWSRHLVVALVPRATDPEPYMADALVTHSVVFTQSGLPAWTTRPSKGGHPLLGQLKAAGDAGIIIFTSGSTGRPKAAVHGVDRFLHKFDRPGRALRTLAFLQLDHVAGLDTLLYTLGAGGGLVVPADRDPGRICALIEAAGVEALSVSPSFLRLLWASGAVDRHNLSSLVVVTYGSEPMDAATLLRINQLFPDVRISQKYGTTETGAPRMASRASDSLWMQVRDAEVETQVRDGILWIRSQGAFLGYLNAPTPFDEAGWYCTGDLVEQDGKWLHVLGREGDLINVGGEKVSPVEVEQVILQLDEIASVAVSGRAHPLMGQIVVAEVVLREGVDAELAETLVRRHCRNRLPRHKVPVTVDVKKGPLSSDRQKVLRNRN